MSASRPETESAGAGVAPHVSLRGEIAPLVEQASRRRVLVARLRRAKWGIAALGVMLAILASAVLAPWIAPADPLVFSRSGGPSWTAVAKKNEYADGPVALLDIVLAGGKLERPLIVSWRKEK